MGAHCDSPQHRFYLLTKQQLNLPKFNPFPKNAWVGVSLTHYTDNTVSNFRGLSECDAKVRFVSLEPLLGSLQHLDFLNRLMEGINWVIIGAMTCGGGEIAKLSSKYPGLTPMPYSNRYTLQPKIEWMEEIMRAADKAGVKVFLKDNLRPLLVDALFKGVISRKQFFNDRELRQELSGD